MKIIFHYLFENNWILIKPLKYRLVHGIFHWGTKSNRVCLQFIQKQFYWIPNPGCELATDPVFLQWCCSKISLEFDPSCITMFTSKLMFYIHILDDRKKEKNCKSQFFKKLGHRFPPTEGFLQFCFHSTIKTFKNYKNLGVGSLCPLFLFYFSNLIIV